MARVPDLTRKLQTGTMAIECFIWGSGTQGVEGSLSEVLLLDRSMGANLVLVLLSMAPGLGSPSLWTLRALET